MTHTVVAILVVSFVVATLLAYRHQCLLRDRARLMHDAIRHRDFTFRLPTKGLLFGERALQEVLNDMGQDIQRLVAQGEVESWQRLTRVLTHEIMNATTPIRSISQAYLSDPSIKGSAYEEGIRAIRDTSMGLAVFVDSYRKLTQLQQPVMADLPLADFVRGIRSLYTGVEWRTYIPADLTIRTDGSLLRQVVVNLIKNAVEAGAKRVGIEWEGAELRISNDGSPILEEVRRDMFVPFYTTKPSGLGVGLALSRQVMSMLGGSLVLADNAQGGYHTTFVLSFEPYVPD